MNFGAGKYVRIKETLKCMISTAAFFGIIWTVLICAFPKSFINVFMTATDHIFSIAPSIMRMYGVSFLILPFNVFSTYYFQSVMRPNISLIIASARGVIISGIFIILLPAVFGADMIWMTMPMTELIVMVYVIWSMKRVGKTPNLIK